MSLATVTVRIAFASNPFAAPSWTDVTSLCMGFSTRRGRQHELDRMEAGTATITLLNTNGALWPNNTGGAYYPNILPGKRINIRATYNAVTYDLYTGFIEKWDPDFILKPIKGAVMKLSCVDIRKNLSRLYLNNAGYSAELSGTRIGRLLTALGWTDTSLDAGKSTMRATGALADENATGHMSLVEASELGIVYQAPDGVVVFEDRHHRLINHTTSVATFSDTGDLPFYRIFPAFDDEFIYNDVRITREGGAQQAAVDTASADVFGKRSLSKTGLLMTTDGEALDQANYLESRYDNPVQRIKAIALRPDKEPATVYPKALGYDISTRIKVKLSQALIDADYHIEGISHDWEPGAPWETRWELSGADNQAYWALGITNLSEMGQTTVLCY